MLVEEVSTNPANDKPNFHVRTYSIFEKVVFFNKTLYNQLPKKYRNGLNYRVGGQQHISTNKKMFNDSFKPNYYAFTIFLTPYKSQTILPTTH